MIEKLKNMKILVTGGSGFIGSNFVKTALKHNHRVINVDALTYASNTATLKSLADNQNYYFYHLDIRDKASVEQIVKAHFPDAIVHLAAGPMSIDQLVVKRIHSNKHCWDVQSIRNCTVVLEKFKKRETISVYSREYR